MNAEMYEALIAAGAPEDKARVAAISMSEESRATKRDTAEVRHDIRESEYRLKLWSTGLAGIVIAALAVPNYFG